MSYLTSVVCRTWQLCVPYLMSPCHIIHDLSVTSQLTRGRMPLPHSGSWFAPSAPWWNNHSPLTTPQLELQGTLISPSGRHYSFPAVAACQFIHGPPHRGGLPWDIAPGRVFAPWWCAGSWHRPDPLQSPWVTRWYFPWPAWIWLWRLRRFLQPPPILPWVSWPVVLWSHEGPDSARTLSSWTSAGRGAGNLIHGLLSDNIHHLQQIDDVRAVLHGFPGRQSF